MSTVTGQMSTAGYGGSRWWAVAMRGVIAILIGLAFLLRPSTSVVALVFLFGVYAFTSGLIAIVTAIRSAESHTSWLPLLFDGLIGVAVGLITFFWPGITALSILYLIAIWAVLIGIFQIVEAFSAFGGVAGTGLMLISGLLSIALGIIFFVHPFKGIAAMIWVLGIYALIFGVTQIFLGFQVRRMESAATT